MIPRLLCLACSALLLVAIGCNGGGGALEIGPIEGPSLIAENSSMEFSITVSGDAGISYAWAVEPSSAGSFANQTSPTATFNSTSVDGHLDAVIRVTVRSGRYGPEVRSMEIEIREIGNLSVLEIDGPDDVEENTASEFSIKAEGDFGIEYEWSCDPPVAGTFTSLNSDKTHFRAAYVGSDLPVTISVTVTSDSFGPVTRTTGISVRETEVLEAGEIEGPSLIEEKFPVQYGVEASGDSGITYLWTVDPPSAGSFDDPTSPNPVFTTTPVSGEESATVSVVVESDFYPPEHRDLGISVLDLPEYAWGVSWGGEGYCSIEAMAADPYGNSYLTGTIEGIVEFGPGGPVLESIDQRDVFIASFDTSGNIRWAVSFGGDENDEVIGLFVDSAGNSYIAGRFYDFVDFDPGPANYLLHAGAATDVYLMSVDANGQFRWAVSWGNLSEYDHVALINGDQWGSVYVLGDFRGQVDFDPGPGVVMKSHEDDWYEVFYLSKFDSSGQFQWVLTGEEGDGLHYAADYVVANDGSLWLAGSFNYQEDFDPGPSMDERSSRGHSDAFLSKLGPSGEYLGTAIWGGWSDDMAKSIAIDSTGAIMVCGTFRTVTDLDPGPGFIDAGYEDLSEGAFLSRFDSSMNLIRAMAWYGDGTVSASRLLSDNSGGVYVKGHFDGTIDLDPTDRELIKTGRHYTSYISHFDSSGNLLWNMNPRENNPNFGRIAVDPADNIYVATSVGVATDLDPTGGIDEHSCEGESDSALFKLLPTD